MQLGLGLVELRLTLHLGVYTFFFPCPPQDTIISINTCESQFDTTLAIAVMLPSSTSITMDDLFVIAADDNAGVLGPCPGTPQSALEDVPLTGGVEYIIIVVGRVECKLLNPLPI